MSAPPALDCFAELGRALRILRDRAKLSITVLAGQAEMGKSQLSKYETGVELPKLETLARLLDALEVEPLGLFHLMHQLSREQPGDSLKADLLFANAGRLLETRESESFRRLLESVFELHSAVVEGRLRTPLERKKE